MEDNLKNIQSLVFAKRPVLKEIAGKFSEFMLRDYVKQHWDTPPTHPDEIFLGVLKAELLSIYGQNVANAAVLQLQNKAVVSTIDHHGIWNHAIFVNSDLIYSLAFEPGEMPLVFATESVSLNNTSSWSGSLLYHHGLNNKLNRLSFFPDAKKTLPVFSAPAFGNSDLMRLRKRLPDNLLPLMEKLDLTSVLGAANFSSQAAKISFNFWQTVFPSAPKIIYVPLETLMLNYLLNVFEDTESFLHQLVLTKPGQQLWQKYFSQEQTFMFWGIGANGRREALSVLPDGLLGLMSRRQVYPSSPLCFIILLMVGLACVGGFTQTTWLTEVKEKFLLLLKDFPNIPSEQIMRLEDVPTKNFAESSLAFLHLDHKYINPSAVDLFLTGQDNYLKYLKLAEQITLGQSFELALPTIYSVVVPKAGQGQFNLEDLNTQVFKELGMERILTSLKI